MTEPFSRIGAGDFLRELEAARLIASADFPLDQAAAQGRDGERQRPARQDGAARERLRAQLGRGATCAAFPPGPGEGRI